MPTAELVDAFVALVERSRTVEAMECFYAADATMRENMGTPRVGKVALIAHEQAALASIRRLHAQCVRPVFISGDRVVIRWIFEIEDLAGSIMRFEELAYQRWAAGQIVEEQFFYDPAQFRAVPA